MFPHAHSVVALAILTAVLSSAAPSSCQTEDEGVDGILELYRDSRPTARELSLYRLDWAQSLEEARERSKEQNRPIFLAIISQTQGDIDIYGGHC